MALTKSQIRSRINSLSREKAGYVGERTKYKTSLDYAERLVRNLDTSSNYLISSNDYMKRFFTINNKTADNGEIVTSKEQIGQMIKKLNNTIIPTINRNISDLNNKISRIEKQISELRRQLASAEE